MTTPTQILNSSKHFINAREACNDLNIAFNLFLLSPNEKRFSEIQEALKRCTVMTETVIEPLKNFNPIVNVEADLRGDEDVGIKFICEVDGPILQFAGNGVEIAIKLEDEHLQTIVNALAEWGWTSPKTEMLEDKP